MRKKHRFTIPVISMWYNVASITGANYYPDIIFNYACCQALVNNNFYTKKQLY